MGRPALAAYRNLLRARAAAFRGDAVALSAARQEIRQRFDESRQERDPAVVDGLLADAQEAAEFLRNFVVQAELNTSGNFELKLGPQHTGMKVEVPGSSNCGSGTPGHGVDAAGGSATPAAGKPAS